MNIFEKCVDVILKHEGGYQAHPKDPGNYVDGVLVGTKYGIAAKFFPHVDIKTLNKAQAKQIYYDHYWNPMNLGGIRDLLAVLHIFDMGVNAGKGTAVKIAQKIVGTTQDGYLGPVTIQAINAHEGFVEEYIEARKAYYKALAGRKKSMQAFLKGWLNRVDSTTLW